MTTRIVCGYTDRTETIKESCKIFFPCLQHCIHFVTVIVGFSMFSRKCNVKNGPSKETDGRFMLM